MSDDPLDALFFVPKPMTQEQKSALGSALVPYVRLVEHDKNPVIAKTGDFGDLNGANKCIALLLAAAAIEQKFPRSRRLSVAEIAREAGIAATNVRAYLRAAPFVTSITPTIFEIENKHILEACAGLGRPRQESDNSAGEEASDQTSV